MELQEESSEESEEEEDVRELEGRTVSAKGMEVSGGFFVCILVIETVNFSFFLFKD